MLLICSLAKAQQSDYGISLNASKGFLIAHRPVLTGLVTQHTQQYGLNVYTLNADSSTWVKNYGYIKKGINVSYTNPGNNSILGNIYTVTPFIEVPFFPHQKNSLQLKLGIGLGYISRIFSPTENFENVAIGTHINASVIFEVSQYFKLTDYTSLMLGFRFHHLSNGAFKVPNLGYNIPQISLGIAWNKTPEIGKKLTSNFNKKTYLEAILGLGIKENRGFGGKKFGIASILPSYNYRLSYKSSIGAFAEFTVNNAINTSNNDTPLEGGDKQQIALGAQYKIHFGKLEAYLANGYYLKNKDPEIGNVLSRLGFNYFLTQNIFASTYLKSHNFKADHIGLGLGYLFINSRKYD